MRVQRGVHTPSGPQRMAASCWRNSSAAPATRHNAPITRSGVRWGAETTATPLSQAPPMPADANSIGRAEQGAPPNAAAIPARLSAPVLIHLGGLGIGGPGDA